MAKGNKPPAEIPPAPAAPAAPEPAATFDIPALEAAGPSGEIPQPAAPASESPETGPAAPRSDERGARRGRGRPAGSRTRGGKPPAEPPAPPSPDDIATLSRALGMSFGVGFSILARARGKHWELGPDDRQQLGDAWGPALAPYMGAVTKYAPIVGALLVTWEKFDARMQLDGMRQVVPVAAGGVEVGRVE